VADDKPKVRVTIDSSDPKPWGVTCDLCPDGDMVRFYARHWAVAHANTHACLCPNAPKPVSDAPPYT